MNPLPEWMHITPVTLDYWLDVYAKAMLHNEVDSLPPPLIELVLENPDLQRKLAEKYDQLKKDSKTDAGNEFL